MAPLLDNVAMSLLSKYNILHRLYLKTEKLRIKESFFRNCIGKKVIPNGLRLHLTISHKPSIPETANNIKTVLNNANSQILEIILKDVQNSLSVSSQDFVNTRDVLSGQYGETTTNYQVGIIHKLCKHELERFSLIQKKKLNYLSSDTNIANTCNLDTSTSFSGSLRISADRYELDSSTHTKIIRPHRKRPRKIKQAKSKQAKIWKSKTTTKTDMVSKSKNQFDPILLTDKIKLTDDQISICRLPDCFAPTPKEPIDVADQVLGTHRWAEHLRWHNYHSKKNQMSQSKETFEKMPWYSPTARSAPRNNPALETFIKACTDDFLDVKSRRKIKDNLTQGQRQALRDLRNLPITHNVACRYADKSGTTIITNLEEDDRKIIKELKDADHYDLLNKDPTEETKEKVNKWADKWMLNGTINVDIGNYVKDIQRTRPGKCKPLTKTHKPQPYPIRLLLSGCGTPTQHLSKFVQMNIRHLTSHMPYQVIDSKEFLQKIESINQHLTPLPDSAVFAACDVVNLYPNVNNNMGVPATKSMLDQFPSPLDIPTSCVLDALSLCLDNNACVYKSETETIYAKPNQGTAMGPSHACDYVDVFMSRLDEELVASSPVPLLSSTLPLHLQNSLKNLDWSRFRDDGFTILLDENQVTEFESFLQDLHPHNIKWTVTSGREINYLDVTLKIQDGKIITDVYSKHNHSYLPPTSCHSPAVFKGLIQGIGTRLRMIVSDDSTLHARLKEYANYLTLSGWDYKLALSRLEEGARKDRARTLSKPRKKKAKKIAWVSTYDPRLPSKSTIIKKNIHLLYADKENEKLFPKKMVISADRKRPNLASMYKPTVPQRWRQHGPVEEPGFFTCKKRCDTCRHSVPTKVLKSPWDGRNWRIRQHLTCDPANVVYVIQCTIHNEWYTGSTTNIKCRWRNHKSDTKNKKITKCRVAEHVSKYTHPDDPELQFLRIIPIEKVAREEDLLERETFWMCNLGTVFAGMNSRKDYNTCNKNRKRWD